MPRGDDNSGCSTEKDHLHSTGTRRSTVECSVHSPHKPSHLLATTLLVFWLTTHQTFSQLHDVAFGTVEVFPTPEQLQRFRLVGANGRGEQRLLLWTPGSTTLYSVKVPFSAGTPTFSVQYSAVPFDDLFVADVNGDGREDLLFVLRSAQRLEVVLNAVSDSLRVSTTIQLPVMPMNVLVGDVNNDTRIDILVADRNNPGIIPLLGLGNGTFRQAAMIAPDNAIEDMALLYLNNDFISDLVYYDWVKSELHFSYGVGRGRFLDLMTLPVEGAVKTLSATPLASGRFMDLVLEQAGELQVWEGDVTGDFRKKLSLPLQQPIHALEIADINNDGRNDIATLDRSGELRVMLHPLDEDGASELSFFAGADAQQLLLADCNNDKNLDALVLRGDKHQLVVYYNATVPRVLTDSLHYATGIDPRAVWIGDIDRNGRNDVAVLNRGSSTLSIFSGTTPAGISGQITVPLPKSPRQLAFHSASDSTANFLVSYPSSRSISFLSIHRNDFSTVNAFIPEVGELELLFANTGEQGLAEFFCFNLASAARSPSLIFYQQLEQQTFIERTFRLSIPDVLLGAAAGDVNEDGIVDIAFAYRNDALNRNELVLSLGDSSLSYKSRYQVLPLPEGTPRKSHLWLQDFDRNDTLDLLLVFPQTLKQMMLARGMAGRKFQITQRFSEEVVLADRSQLQIVDLNRDGILDLAIHNSSNNTIGWYPGQKGGNFGGWVSLLRKAGVSSYAFGDLNGDGVSDLAVTLNAEGILTFYDGRLLFKTIGGDVGR